MSNKLCWSIEWQVEQQRYKCEKKPLWVSNDRPKYCGPGPGHPGQQLECIRALDLVRGGANQRPVWGPGDQSEAVRVQSAHWGEEEEWRVQGEQKVKISRDSQDWESSNNSYSVPRHDHHLQSSSRCQPSSGGFKLLDFKKVPPPQIWFNSHVLVSTHFISWSSFIHCSLSVPCSIALDRRKNSCFLSPPFCKVSLVFVFQPSYSRYSRYEPQSDGLLNPMHFWFSIDVSLAVKLYLMVHIVNLTYTKTFNLDIQFISAEF